MTQLAQTISTEDHALAASLGDLDALAALFERFHDPLVNYLRCRTSGNQVLAEDIAATTWEKVVVAMPSYVTKGNGFEAWLWEIARNALRGHMRWLSRRPPERLDGEMLAHERASDGANPDDVFMSRFEQHQIAAAVNALPAAQRRCVILRFFSGLTTNEVARIMGKTPGGIKQLQLRALRRLSKEVGDLANRDAESYEVVGSLSDRPTTSLTGGAE